MTNYIDESDALKRHCTIIGANCKASGCMSWVSGREQQTVDIPWPAHIQAPMPPIGDGDTSVERGRAFAAAANAAVRPLVGTLVDGREVRRARALDSSLKEVTVYLDLPPHGYCRQLA